MIRVINFKTVWFKFNFEAKRKIQKMLNIKYIIFAKWETVVLYPKRAASIAKDMLKTGL